MEVRREGGRVWNLNGVLFLRRDEINRVGGRRWRGGLKNEMLFVRSPVLDLRCSNNFLRIFYEKCSHRVEALHPYGGTPPWVLFIFFGWAKECLFFQHQLPGFWMALH